MNGQQSFCGLPPDLMAQGKACMDGSTYMGGIEGAFFGRDLMMQRKCAI
jgi:hypothetical protein